MDGIELEDCMPPRGAFWLSPNCTLTRVRTSHIKEIIDHPGQFGVSSREIEARYEHYGETMPAEGRARQEIICAILPQGWIRIRNQGNYWSLTIHEWTGDAEARALAWLKAFHDDGIIKDHSDLQIHETASGADRTVEARELLPRARDLQLPRMRVGEVSREPILEPLTSD